MDMDRLDERNPAEIEFWATEMAVSPERLREAIRAVGTDIDKLKGYLASAGGNQGREHPG